jgi:hypothetical protein
MRSNDSIHCDPEQSFLWMYESNQSRYQLSLNFEDAALPSLADWLVSRCDGTHKAREFGHYIAQLILCDIFHMALLSHSRLPATT